MHRPHPVRSRFWVGSRAGLFGLAVLALMLVACGSDNGEEEVARWDEQSIAQTHEAAGFFPQMLNSTRLAQGENRVQVAFFYPDQTMVEHAEVEARFYRLDQDGSDPEHSELVTELALTERTLDFDAGQPFGAAFPALSPPGALDQYVSAVPPLDVDARHVHHDGEHVTVYTAHVEFDSLGWWGAEFDVSINGDEYRNVRMRFPVQERTPEPMLGEAIPASEQLTAADVDDIADIDSTIPPNPDLHQVTVAEALEEGRPLVIAFVTPAFCETRFCGPVMEAVVLPAWEQYGDEVRFIHIEPYDIPRAREGTLQPTEVTMEWNLMVEPVIFVTDGEGHVTAKLEGIVELEELEEAIEAALAQT